MLVPFLIVILILVLMLVFKSLQKNKDNNIINPIWKKIETVFIVNGGPGSWSSNRVSFIFTMLISNIIVWGAILYLVIVNSEFPNIPDSIVVIYGLANGIASAAKLWQKREERYFSEGKKENKE